MSDYDVLRTSDGEPYTSTERLAGYEWKPGKTYIMLSDVSGQWYEGYIEQGEKADGICRAWIEDGYVDDRMRPGAAKGRTT